MTIDSLSKTATANAVRESHVEAQLNQLSHTVDETSKLVAEFESRLSDVIRPEEPDGEGKDQCADPKLVKTAERIRIVARTVSATNSKLRSILSRCEA